jgi:hypothetical protein
VSDRLPSPMRDLSGSGAVVERASATPARRVAAPGPAPVQGPRALREAPRSLAEIQRWTFGAITAPDPDAREVEAVLVPSASLSAAERLEIYRAGYRSRLVDCLRDDYPVLAETLGDACFEALAQAYIARHPSTGPNLNPFGRHMPAFCREVEIAGFAPNAAFAADLAALEWALVEVLHAEVSEGLSLAALQQIPPDAWSSVRLVRADAVRVLRADFPVNAHYQTSKTAGAPPPVPARAPSAVAVYRHGVSLWRMDLTPAMANLLEALFGGTPLGGALAVLGEGLASSEEVAEAERSVMIWFREWVKSGFFSRVETA